LNIANRIAKKDERVERKKEKSLKNLTGRNHDETQWSRGRIEFNGDAIAKTHLIIVDNNFCTISSLIGGAHFSALRTIFIKRDHFPTAGNRYPRDTAAVLHAKRAK